MQPHDRVLIVCEGAKTEPNYFQDLRKRARIPTAVIKIMPSALGTQPLQVVEFAIAEFNRTRAYDRVYAVFDRDTHPTYANAIGKAEAYCIKLKTMS